METFTMSRKEVPRAGLVKAALAGKITNQEGARALRLSVRQFKRLKTRFRADGARGLLHRSRGRVSRRRLPPEVRTQVVRLLTTLYEGFNDVHLTEKLQERHALPISRASVRRLRLALGRPARRRRRAPSIGVGESEPRRWGSWSSSMPARLPGSKTAAPRPRCMASSTTPRRPRWPCGFRRPRICTAISPCWGTPV